MFFLLLAQLNSVQSCTVTRNACLIVAGIRAIENILYLQLIIHGWVYLNKYLQKNGKLTCYGSKNFGNFLFTLGKLFQMTL